MTGANGCRVFATGNEAGAYNLVCLWSAVASRMRDVESRGAQGKRYIYKRRRRAAQTVRISRTQWRRPNMSSLADINSHVRDVLNTVHNQSPTRQTSDSVAQSWTRCLNEFGLDPGRFIMPPVLTQHELSSRREAATDLIACSKLEMTTLYQQLADPSLAVVLTDADGVIVHQVSS